MSMLGQLKSAFFCIPFVFPDRLRSRSQRTAQGDRSQLRFAWHIGVASMLSLLSLSLASADTNQLQFTIPSGEYAYSPDNRVQTETLSFPQNLTTALLGLSVNDVVELSEFPLAPGVRTPLVVQRYDVYAPGARLFVIDGNQPARQLPRSQHLHFLGFDPHDPSTRIGFSLDPVTHTFQGLSTGRFGTTEIVPLENRLSSPHQIHDTQFDTGLPLETTCGADDLPLPLNVLERASLPPPLALPKAAGITHSATIAIDTDNEFNHKKFNNNTANATDWIADLFTQMNVMYERDLSLRLVQGDTFLRRDLDPSPTYNDDPWTVSGSGASSSQLNEFGTYWSANMGSVNRVFAALLSGKSSSGFSASGIAWLDGYCETQNSGGGYSVNQIFTASIPVSNDAGLVGHELGHNLGSPHTHCYSPPVDTCYALESGCYSGSVSCPVTGRGTLMSYCHFSNGANCGSNLDEFHPTVVGLISDFVNNHTPSCIQPLDFIFTDGFESGNTSAWSSSVP